MTRTSPFLYPFAFLLTITASAAAAEASQSGTSPAPANRYNLTEVMIPMRDGVKLHTKILRPKSAEGRPWPFVMIRTPYGIGSSERLLDEYLRALADEGYIFVFQDIRGRFGSEGTFVMQRPPARGRAIRRRSTKAPTPTTPSTGL